MRYMKAELKRSICNGQVFLAMLLCLGIYAFGEGYQGWVNIVLYPGTTWIHNHNGFMMEFNPFRSLLPLPAVSLPGICSSRIGNIAAFSSKPRGVPFGSSVK